MAYAVLSDPNKKRQYDLHGEGEGMGELSTINVEDLGTVGRWDGNIHNDAMLHNISQAFRCSD